MLDEYLKGTIIIGPMYRVFNHEGPKEQELIQNLKLKIRAGLTVNKNT